MKKKYLIIGSASSKYTTEYIRNVIDLGCYDIDIANIDFMDVEPSNEQLEYYKENHIRLLNFKTNGNNHNRLLFVIYKFINLFKMRICKQYDIIHIHYITEESVGAAFFKNSNCNLIATIYGSDLLRASSVKKKLIGYVFKKAAYITAATKPVHDAVLEIDSNLKNKIVKVDLGSENIEYVKSVLETVSKKECREKYKVPCDKFIVFIGYNGNPAHRHIDAMRALETLPGDVKEQIFLVLHCSYSLTKEYLSDLQTYLKGSSLNGKIVLDYMVGEDLIEFRYCGDVLFNLQQTDVLSASMMENIALGNLVVKGEWLRYPDLEENNINLINITSMDDLPFITQKILTEPSLYSVDKDLNSAAAYKMVSWTNHIPIWRAIIEERI